MLHRKSKSTCKSYLCPCALKKQLCTCCDPGTRKRYHNSTAHRTNDDLDSNYPLFLTSNERTEDDYDHDHHYDINDVLLTFTIRNLRIDILRQPVGLNRKLAESAHSDSTTQAENEDEGHGHEGEGDHGDAHDMDMVVHDVTYEYIYAILVFLVTATALGIVTSKLGMFCFNSPLYLVGEIITGFVS